MTLSESAAALKKWKADDLIPIVREVPFITMGGVRSPGNQFIEEVYPGDFCEMSRAHADFLGIEAGDPVRVERGRASVIMRAVIGPRSVPFQGPASAHKTVTLTCTKATARALNLSYPFAAWNDVPVIVKAVRRA